MRHSILILLAILFWEGPLTAQSWEWVQTAGSEKEVNVGTAVTTDAAGNIYMTGYHHAPFHLHQDVRSSRSTKLISSPRRDDHMFLAKYDINGNLKWANYAIGEYVEALDVATDASGNVYVTGHFSSRTKFSSIDDNSIRMDGYAPGLMFLAKYSSRGQLKWVVKGGARTGRNAGHALIVDGSRIMVAGYSEIKPGEKLVYKSTDYTEDSFEPFKASGDFNPIVGSLIIYDRDGRLFKTRFWGGPEAKVFFHDLKKDNRGNLYFAGTFEGFFKENSEQFQTEARQEQGLVMAYDSRGQMRWNMQVEGYFNPNSLPRLALERDKLALAFAAKGRGRVLFAHDRPLTFGHEELWSSTLVMAQMDLKGKVLWAHDVPIEQGTLGLHDLDFDRAGKLYLAGHYSEVLRLGKLVLRSNSMDLAMKGGETQPEEVISEFPNDRNLFIARIDQRGRPDWAIGTEGGRYEVAYGLTLDSKDRIYATGYFNGEHNVRFGNAPVREFGKVNVFLGRIDPTRREGEIQHPELPRITQVEEEAPEEEAKNTYTSPVATQYTRGRLGRQLIKRQEIRVNRPYLDLYIWDNHKIDGDIISLYANDSCILKSFAMNGQSRHLQVIIPTNRPTYLKIVAENVGEITPNTTAVIVEDGQTRQRVHLQSDMYRSEVLTIHYKGTEGFSSKATIATPETSNTAESANIIIPDQASPLSQGDRDAKDSNKPFWKFWKGKKKKKK